MCPASLLMHAGNSAREVVITAVLLAGWKVRSSYKRHCIWDRILSGSFPPAYVAQARCFLSTVRRSHMTVRRKAHSDLPGGSARKTSQRIGAVVRSRSRPNGHLGETRPWDLAELFWPLVSAPVSRASVMLCHCQNLSYSMSNESNRTKSRRNIQRSAPDPLRPDAPPYVISSPMHAACRS